jgi:high-affinity iron transporter
MVGVKRKMITPMVIAFKESLEALLILVPLLVYLHKIDRRDLSKFIYRGGTLGLSTTIITGDLILVQFTTLQGYSNDFFSGSMMLFLAGLILYNIVWMGKKRKNVSLDVNKKYISKLTNKFIFTGLFYHFYRQYRDYNVFVTLYK